MAADTCEACGEGTVAMDTVYGILACDNCGRVFDDVETYLGAHHQAGLVMERGGTFVKSTESGALAACGLGGSAFRSANRDDTNKREVLSKMRETSAILRVPAEKVDDVKHMLERLLEGEWGQGRWVDVLVAACIYVAIRQSRLPLTLVEVASSVDCGIVELGRMYRRVLDALHLELPDTDPHIFMERALASLTRSKGLSRDLSRAMARQGALLLDCSRHWFITTGRRPLPVVAAVITLVAEANQVKLEFEDVVRELYSHPRTSRLRLAELREALVGVGQKLPWGGDITVKTLEKHLPFLLKFLEVDVKRARKKNLQLDCGKDSSKETSIAGRQPGATTGATTGRQPATAGGTTGGRGGRQPGATTGRQLTTAETRTEATTGAPVGRRPVATTGRQPAISGAAAGVTTGTQPATTGLATGATTERQPPGTQHGGSVELRLVEALKRKEVEWQAWPKSFLVGADAHARRCGKIRAAMERIRLAKQGLLSRVDGSQPKRRKEESPRELDWEDLVIEYLLLRGVEQTQLEDGYYRAALGVHHMQSTEQIDDDELVPYLRSKAEVKMLKSLQDVGDTNLPTQPL